MPGNLDVRSPSVSTTGYADGLGRRIIRFDRELGATLECVQLRPELAVYEHGLRAHAATIAALDDERFVPVREIVRDGARVSVTSELVAGDRLSDIIEARSLGDAAVSGLDAAFGFLLQVLPALARLHTSGLVHGIVAPGRVVLTSSAQVVLSDPIYGGVLPRLNLSRVRLWTEFQVVAPPSAGAVRFDAAADVAQASLCGLMLALGRVIDAHDPADLLPALLAEAVEIAQIRGGDRLGASVRQFFEATLPLSQGRPPANAERAGREAHAIANRELGEDACITALGDFVRYDPPPAPVPVPAAARIAVVTLKPAPPIEEPPVQELPLQEAAVARGANEAAVAEFNAAIAEFDAADEEPEVLAFVERTPEPPLEQEPLRAVKHEEARPFALDVEPVREPMPIAYEPVVVLSTPEPVAEPVAPVPVPEPVAAPIAPVVAAPVVPAPIAPVEEPLIAKPSGDIVFQPPVAPVAAPPPAPVAPPVVFAPPPAPVAPPVVFAPPPPPMPVFQAPPTASAPTRAATVAPNPFAFSHAQAPAPIAPPAPLSAAPLRLKQDGPSGYAPQRSAPRFDPEMADMPFPQRTVEGSSGGFPKKLAIAVMVIMVAAVAGGRYLLMQDRAAATDRAESAEKEATTPSKAAAAAPAKAQPTAGSTGTLTIESIPTGARVLLNGTPAGETPLKLEGLPEGRHNLTLITNSVTVKRTVRVEAGKTVALDIPVFSGWVAVFAPIVLDVSEGSKGLGSTEQGRILLAPGRHVLTVSNRQLGYTSSHTVEISAGEETPLNLTPTGEVNVNAAPWAEVWVDGNRVGETPIAKLEVPLGTREFVFKNPQHGERRVTVTVTSTPSTVTIDFTKPGLTN